MNYHLMLDREARRVVVDISQFSVYVDRLTTRAWTSSGHLVLSWPDRIKIEIVG